MLRDIYVRNPDDPKFVQGKIEENETVQELISQLKIMFSTSPGEVIAFPDYGINLETMLFELDFDRDDLLSELNRQYFKYISPFFPDMSIEFDAYVNDGDTTKTLILDVYINSVMAFKIIS